MQIKILNQIEENIKRLSTDEQLYIIERIAKIIREKTLKESTLKNQLTAMANDLEIQKELCDINREFAHTESDGLENI